MKQLLAIIAIVSLASCWDQAKQPTAVRKDTTFTPVLYMADWRTGTYETGTAEKTWSETLKPDPKDSTKNIRVVDSAYRLAIFFQVRDTISPGVSVPKLDSLGVPVRRLLGLNPLPSKFIVKDYNIDLLKLK